jgi:hypothetical protein
MTVSEPPVSKLRRRPTGEKDVRCEMNRETNGDATGSAVAGGFGAVIALALGDWMVSHPTFFEHARLALHGPWTPTLDRPMALRAAVGFAIVAGSIFGALLGRLTQRLSSVGGRILFDAVLVPALCTIVYAFVVPRYAPAVARVVPFAAALLATVAYAVCVALAPPVRAHRIHSSSL